MNINEITAEMTPQEKEIYFAHQEKRHREEKEKLYASMVRYAESGDRLTRFEMVCALVELGIEVNQESLDLVKKLYDDNFIDK